jgi:ArsR family transcriptional regulator
MKRQVYRPGIRNAAFSLFKAMADPVRLRLLSLLATGEICVCHLHEALQLPQPTVSRHLAYLRKRGLVVGRKEGLWVHYRLAEPESELHRKLLDCLACCRNVEPFANDQERLVGRCC